MSTKIFSPIFLFSKNFAISVSPNGKSSGDILSLFNKFLSTLTRFLSKFLSILSILSCNLSKVSRLIIPSLRAFCTSFRNIDRFFVVSIFCRSSKISNLLVARVNFFSRSKFSVIFSSFSFSFSCCSRRRFRDSLYAQGFSNI